MVVKAGRTRRKPVLAEFDLAGHTAIVTGGNRGIGLGIARQLATAGADVAIWGRDAEANAAAAGKLGSRCRSYVCDVSDETQVEAAMTATLSDLGPVSSMFANAGRGGSVVPFTETTLPDWDSVIDVNLRGAFLSFRAAARAMISAGAGGSLVATSSVSTIHGAARGSAYAASKGALDAMVKALSVELARYGIRANAMVPGWIEVERTADAYARPEFQDRVLRRIPARRWGTPDDVGRTAVYLASPASSYLTGTSIVIDGGYTVF
jgi:NAD(P)-dependent dehydrogenase (short-subunit alcohol dehydrogenase family)